MAEARVTITLRVDQQLANAIHDYAETRNLTTTAALIEMIEFALTAKEARNAS